MYLINNSVRWVIFRVPDKPKETLKACKYEMPILLQMIVGAGHAATSYFHLILLFLGGMFVCLWGILLCSPGWPQIIFLKIYFHFT